MVVQPPRRICSDGRLTLSWGHPLRLGPALVDSCRLWLATCWSLWIHPLKNMTLHRAAHCDSRGLCQRLFKGPHCDSQVLTRNPDARSKQDERPSPFPVPRAAILDCSQYARRVHPVQSTGTITSLAPEATFLLVLRGRITFPFSHTTVHHTLLLSAEGLFPQESF